VSALLVGIFVGGRGTRMGGVAKGLLKAPDSEATLVERLLEQSRDALPAAEVALVGETDAYAGFGLRMLRDNPVGIGPLGGLLALLEYADSRAAPFALALACDLPYLSSPLLDRLAHDAPNALALVTQQARVRNPLVARYAVASALPAARRVLLTGARSLQAVLDELGTGVDCLSLSSAEERSLSDWDTPEDIRARGSSGDE
jgi:molybdopterin-guanine dinucleotide biosynthesis protein A